MVHCAHILAPSSAWAASTHSKHCNQSVASRFGDAIRALKPGVKKTLEERVFVLNADLLTEMQEWSVSKQPLTDEDISTEAGTSRRTSRVSEAESRTSSVRELPLLPGCIDEISTEFISHRTTSTKSVEEIPLLPGLIDEMPVSSHPPRKSELDNLAAIVADHAQSKFSGRVYQDVRNAFLAVDANGDGKVTHAEMLAFCQHFNLSSEIASQLFSLLDQHDTGLVHWSSFLTQCAPIFNKKSDHKLNAGVGRKWPAIQ